MSGPRTRRRDALKHLTGALGAPFAFGEQGPSAVKRARPPLNELVNVLEFEDVARQALAPAAFERVAGSDRTAFDRMTLRPRMCIPTLDLDLTVQLFGEPHFTPILVGPAGNQRQFHREGELATVRGAGAAKAGVILSSATSVPIADLATEAKTPLWYAVSSDANSETAATIRRAIDAGCRAVCISVARSGSRTPAASMSRSEWSAIERLRKQADVPVLIKGVLTPQDATTAIGQGVKGLIVSSHGATPAGVAAIEVLSSIVDAAGGHAVVLADGSFRRGTDIVKALILGARGVLVARPVMWGLAAYGADGVQAVVEMLQSDLGRHMGALGASRIDSLHRTFIKVHRT
jgi:isopentenyl diphosphate isomerase/L-lactate dehydrogenase-like FMN-dependent dehydrogenase